MVVTVVVVVATHNLAFGVLAGVLLSSLFFANKIGHFMVVRSRYDGESDTRTYDEFLSSFDVQEGVKRVIIDLGRAHFWDITAVAALDKIVLKFRRSGSDVTVLGLNEASATIVDRFGIHDKPDTAGRLLAN
jgi:SulP family sulfate permease